MRNIERKMREVVTENDAFRWRNAEKWSRSVCECDVKAFFEKVQVFESSDTTLKLEYLTRLHFLITSRVVDSYIRYTC